MTCCGSEAGTRAARALLGALVAASTFLRASAARAETYAFHAYPPDPLPSPTIRTVFQDHEGLLWLGTELGLVRYDGSTFEPFAAGGPASGIGPVERIVEDGAGRVWALGFGGLAVRTSAGVRRITAADGLPGERPTTFVATDDGVVVLMASPPSVLRVTLDAEGRPVLTPIPFGAAGPAGRYRDVAFLRDGTLLVAGGGDGLRVRRPDGTLETKLEGEDVDGTWLLRGGERVLVSSSNGPYVYARGALTKVDLEGAAEGTLLSTALEAHDGSLYTATRDGQLHRCAPGRTDRCAPLLAEKARARIRSLAEDGAGVVWGALAAPALLRHDPREPRASVVDGAKGFPFADVLDVAADRHGFVFVATVAGLVRVESSAIVNYDDRDGVLGSTVWSIARLPAPDGRLAIAAENGVVLWSKDRRITLADPDGPSLDDAVRVLPEDASSLLVGTNDGLYRARLDGDRCRVEPILDVPSRRIESLAKDAHGDVWVAARKSLGVVRGNRLVPVPVPGAGTGDSVDHVAVGRSGILWLATSRGLVGLQGDAAVVHLAQADGLLDNDVDLVFEASDGSVWVGYTKNLGATQITFTGDAKDPTNVRIRHLTTENGLPADSAYAFTEITAEGPARGLWIGTSRGLLRLAPDGTMSRLGRLHGLASDDVSYGGFFADTDGSLWVGTTRGASRIDLTRLPPSLPPIPRLARLDFSDAPPPTDGLVPYERPDFAARFSSLLFRGEDETTFRYRLAGYRDEWTPFRKDRAAVFANLPPGHYRLEVEARTPDGLVSATPARFAFTIVTPFYMTLPFRLGVGLGAALGLASLVRLRMARLRRQNRELEDRVADRTRELEKRLVELRRMNDELVASHKRADRIFSALADALPGTVIDGKYRLEERIGAGGVGVVFKAVHLDLDRPIAVKIFRPQPGNDSADALERFRVEGKSAALIDHPNAVQVYDSGISGDGLAYLVMQYLEGVSLAEAMPEGEPLDDDRTIAIVDAVAGVLAVAHERGIVHRDVKPENVFLQRTPDGEVVKLVDFGIAKLLDGPRHGTPGITLAGDLVGTPAYMAPERFDENTDLVGPPSDVYSLAVLAFRTLTGRLPFEGSFPMILHGHLNAPPPAPSSFRPSLPPLVDVVIRRALSKEPGQRPSADELRRELRSALGRSEGPASSGGEPVPMSVARAVGAA